MTQPSANCASSHFARARPLNAHTLFVSTPASRARQKKACAGLAAMKASQVESTKSQPACV